MFPTSSPEEYISTGSACQSTGFGFEHWNVFPESQFIQPASTQELASDSFHPWHGFFGTLHSPPMYTTTPPSLTHSPSSPPSHFELTPSPPSQTFELPKCKASRRRGSTSSNGSLSKSCSHCGVTSTPLWRRDSAGRHLCNACGLYKSQHGVDRPKALIEADQAEDEEEEYDPSYTGPECSHCRTHHTSVWVSSCLTLSFNRCSYYFFRGGQRPERKCAILVEFTKG